MKSSKHLQIKQYIIGKIADGTLAVGARSPSENELSTLFGVHHCTAEKALRDLAFEGYIERRRGSGSYICNPDSTRSGNVAVIVNDANTGFFGDLVHAIQRGLEPYRRHLIFFSTGERFSLERGYIEQLIEQRRVDGFIIVPALDAEDRERSAFYRDLRRRKVPFVLVFPPTAQPECHCIQTDDRQGTYDAAAWLLSRGHRRLGFVIHQLPDNVIQQQRLEGYRAALADAGLPFREENLISVPYPSLEYGLLAGEKVLAMTDRPSAFLAVADLLAVGLTIRLRERGVAVPGEVEIIGNGNIDLCRPENFNICTIDDSLEQVGEQAVQLLLSEIGTGQSEPSRIVVPQRLIIRPPLPERRA